MKKAEYSYDRCSSDGPLAGDGAFFSYPPDPDGNSLCVDRRPVRRLSPIPPSAHFPTVIEEPATPSREESGPFPDPLNYREAEGEGNLKHRRRLPYISTNMTKNKSSRSFDSGISCLLSGGSGSPSPPLDRDSKQGLNPMSPVCSPVLSRSPVTPSKRASFHALPPRPTPGKGTSGSPSSPFKQSKFGFLSSRRLSEQSSGDGSNNNLGRTLSPCSVNNASNKCDSDVQIDRRSWV